MLSCAKAPLDSRIVERLAGFSEFLRANGFAVSGGDAAQVLRIAAWAGALDSRVLRWSLQALLCSRSSEWRRFDELFDDWFRPANRWQRPQRREASREHGAGVPHGAATNAPAADDEERDANRPRSAASDRAAVGSTDFRALAKREHLLEIEALMRRFARRLKRMRLRREARAQRGRRLDLRTTIRRSVSSGGTPLELAWRSRRRVRPRLVLLVDVSRSMAPYSFFHLRLARALSAELRDVRSFIFHTRVIAVSDALRESDPWRAQEKLRLLAQGFGGGTRIGESLAQFNREHAQCCARARTAVVIVSDGYDTGEPHRLAAALAELRRRVRRIVWLNPLCARADYVPVSQGMQAARPYLDLLGPGGDLASVEAALAPIIEALR